MLIKINKIEQKVGRDSGNPFWTIETDKGKMSCFDKDIADRLYESWRADKPEYVDAQPSKDGKYVNIRKIFNSVEEQGTYDENNRNYEETHPKDSAYPGNITPQKPQDLGKEKFELRPYEKDPVGLVIELVIAGKPVEEAISTVEQAHEAFL